MNGFQSPREQRSGPVQEPERLEGAAPSAPDSGSPLAGSDGAEPSRGRCTGKADVGSGSPPPALNPDTLNPEPSRRFAFTTPRGLLMRAALLALLYLAVNLAGWREHTCFLSGTPADAGGSAWWSALRGAVYLLAHLAFWTVAPVFALAAGLLAAIGRTR